MECYSKCSELVKKFTDIEVSSTQIYRVTDFYGQALSEKISENNYPKPIEKEEILYAQIDGSMVLTREEKWKEVKVGRLFTSKNCLNPNSKNQVLQNSQYQAWLGSSTDFVKKMENSIDNYGVLKGRLVFINDGAIWIKNWIEETYPQAISILDYYHALEYLHDFAKSHFKETDKSKREDWTEKQKELLLDSQVNIVIENIENLIDKSKETPKILSYYTSNKNRMDYKKYKEIGCGIIGSGAIESTHRTLIQVRMKLSGQRWSKKGAKKHTQIKISK